MIAQTLEQLMKPMTEKEATRDAQIAFDEQNGEFT